MKEMIPTQNIDEEFNNWVDEINKIIYKSLGIDKRFLGEPDFGQPPITKAYAQMKLLAKFSRAQRVSMFKKLYIEEV